MATSTKTIDEFIDRIGFAIEAQGLPRIAGRLMAFLLIRGESFSAEELSEALQISRGSVSTNTRLLESLGVIERISRPGDRRDYYHMTSNSHGRMLETHLKGMRHRLEIARDAERGLNESSPGLKSIREMIRFYEFTIAETERVVKQWREEIK